MNKVSIMTILKSTVVLLAFLSSTVSGVTAQERTHSDKTGRAAHCASLIKATQEEYLQRLGSLKPEHIRQIMLRHSQATVQAGDLKAVFTCLKGAVTAAE